MIATVLEFGLIGVKNMREMQLDRMELVSRITCRDD